MLDEMFARQSCFVESIEKNSSVFASSMLAVRDPLILTFLLIFLWTMRADLKALYFWEAAAAV